MAVFAGAMIFVWIFLIALAVLIPVSVYAAQKWAHKCWEELVQVNRRLGILIDLSSPSSEFFQLKLDQASRSKTR